MTSPTPRVDGEQSLCVVGSRWHDRHYWVLTDETGVLARGSTDSPNRHQLMRELIEAGLIGERPVSVDTRLVRAARLLGLSARPLAPIPFADPAAMAAHTHARWDRWAPVVSGEFATLGPGPVTIACDAAWVSPAYARHLGHSAPSTAWGWYAGPGRLHVAVAWDPRYGATSAELRAIALALADLGPEHEAHLLSDSLNCVQGLAYGVTVPGPAWPVTPAEEELREHARIRLRQVPARLDWVRGHAGHVVHDRTDQLVRSVRQDFARWAQLVGLEADAAPPPAALAVA